MSQINPYHFYSSCKSPPTLFQLKPMCVWGMLTVIHIYKICNVPWNPPVINFSNDDTKSLFPYHCWIWIWPLKVCPAQGFSLSLDLLITINLVTISPDQVWWCWLWSFPSPGSYIKEILKNVLSNDVRDTLWVKTKSTYTSICTPLSHPLFECHDDSHEKT